MSVLCKAKFLHFDEFFSYCLTDKNYWMKLGLEDIQEALQRYADFRDETLAEAVAKVKFPKNVILFIGDGMSISTVTGARIHKGQKLFKQSGEEQFLSWERFPASALMKVNMHFLASRGL